MVTFSTVCGTNISGGIRSFRTVNVVLHVAKRSWNVIGTTARHGTNYMSQCWEKTLEPYIGTKLRPDIFTIKNMVP